MYKYLLFRQHPCIQYSNWQHLEYTATSTSQVLSLIFCINVKIILKNFKICHVFPPKAQNMHQLVVSQHDIIRQILSIFTHIHTHMRRAVYKKMQFIFEQFVGSPSKKAQICKNKIFAQLLHTGLRGMLKNCQRGFARLNITKPC